MTHKDHCDYCNPFNTRPFGDCSNCLEQKESTTPVNPVNPTTSDSEAEELDKILFNLAADAVLASTLNTGDLGVDKARVAIQARIAQAEIKGAIAELEKVAANVKPDTKMFEIGRATQAINKVKEAYADVINRELAALQAQLKALEGGDNG